MRPVLAFIDLLQGGLLISIGKQAVVLPALPEFIMKKQVPGTITDGFDIGNQAGCHIERIEKNTIRIL